MFDDLKNPEFTIGEVTFMVNKLNALNGWKVLESIRVQLASTDIGDIDPNAENTDSMISDFFKSILSLDEKFVDDLRIRLFKRIEFKTPEVKSGWLNLESNDEMAFAKLEPSSIYEVLMRALVVNFTESFSDVTSRLKSSGLRLKQ